MDIRDLIQEKLRFSPYEVQALMRSKYGYKIAYMKAWKSRQKTLLHIIGVWEAPFEKLLAYMNMLKDSNPGSIVHWDTSMLDSGRVSLNRVFWSFAPAIEGFKHFRTVISIDATHLIGKWKAYALVEGENIESWKWFMTCIRSGVTQRDGLCIFSDMHIGIMRVMEEEAWSPPRAYHRLCLRHFTSNFNQKAKCLSHKDLFYNIADENHQIKFCNRLKDLKELVNDKPDVVKWLEKVNPEKWSLAYDTNGRRWGSMTTNQSESFNYVLMACRDLPITAIIHFTFKQVNSWFIKRCDEMLDHNNHHVPKIESIINENIEKAGRNDVQTMSRRTRSEAMHDVPSPSHGDDIVLSNLSRIEDSGPIVSTLLYKQPTHRSTRIWETSSTSLLVVRHCGHWVADERILPYIVRAGFGPWYYMQNYEVDWSFMTALVERWRSETHTFHLRYNEMTITLEDVGVLTGLPVEGRAMIKNQEVDDALCLSLLGVVPPTGRRDSSVRRTWFRDTMKKIPEDASEEVIQRYTRAYILVILGSSLFPDSSGSDVSLHYLPLLADLDVWEHLIIGRPRRLAIPAPPSGSDVDPMRLPTLGYKRGCWTAKVPLFCFNIAEWHFPSRVLRHFGWIQPEPALPPPSHKDMHMSKRRTFEPLGEDMQVHINLWDDRVESIITGELDTDGSFWMRTTLGTTMSLVTSIVRTCKVSSGVFLKTTDHDSKRALHDLFHSTRADLLRIGEGLALDVDPAQIHLHDDSDEDVDLPEDNYEVGLSSYSSGVTNDSSSEG
ncbi:hypothetical protein QQ045_032415 [Rhodiola kirilowii]